MFLCVWLYNVYYLYIYLFDTRLLFCFNSIWSYFCPVSLHALEGAALTQQTYRSPSQDTTSCDTTVWDGPVLGAAMKYLRLTDSFSQWLHGKSLTLWGQCRTVNDCPTLATRDPGGNLLSKRRSAHYSRMSWEILSYFFFICFFPPSLLLSYVSLVKLLTLRPNFPFIYYRAIQCTVLFSDKFNANRDTMCM